jgi:hypothetical protein
VSSQCPNISRCTLLPCALCLSLAAPPRSSRDRSEPITLGDDEALTRLNSRRASYLVGVVRSACGAHSTAPHGATGGLSCLGRLPCRRPWAHPREAGVKKSPPRRMRCIEALGVTAAAAV